MAPAIEREAQRLGWLSEDLVVIDSDVQENNWGIQAKTHGHLRTQWLYPLHCPFSPALASFSLVLPSHHVSFSLSPYPLFSYMFFSLCLCSVFKYLISLSCFSSYYFSSPPSAFPSILVCLPFSLSPAQFFSFLCYVYFLSCVSSILESPVTHHIKWHTFPNLM